MTLLAFETCTATPSVALSAGGETTQRCVGRWGDSSSRGVLSTAADLLGEAGLSLGDVTGVVVDVGPGSFTGIRSGCSIAMGLASAKRGLSIYAVSSLDVVAHHSGGDPVLAILDARMDEAYWALYRRCQDGALLRSHLSCTPPEMISLPDGPGMFHVCGEGYGRFSERLPLSVRCRLQPGDDALLPSAGMLLEFALSGLEKHRIELQQLAPLYVRDKVALTSAERQKAGGSR